MQEEKKTSINSGSYNFDDVQFLLSEKEIEYTSLSEKEQLIQSGKKHYSEMLTKELPPSPEHIELYQNAMKLYGLRVATEVISLAKGLVKQFQSKPITLVSLVRAGIPLGVCLQHTLKDMGVKVTHYGISIIRDKGIDRLALDKILSEHEPDTIVFVDGWTGKGAISKELTKCIQAYPQIGTPKLVVLADPCGVAWMASSYDDWLIPFGILGSPISGLISRTLWNEDHFHGVVLCNHLLDFDVSNDFVSTIDSLRATINSSQIESARIMSEVDLERNEKAKDIMNTINIKYSVGSLNRIKPGIAEATRAVMRRVPEHILVRDINDPDLKLLIYLADKAGVRITQVPELVGNYRAITIIKKVI